METCDPYDYLRTASYEYDETYGGPDSDLVKKGTVSFLQAETEQKPEPEPEPEPESEFVPLILTCIQLYNQFKLPN